MRLLRHPRVFWRQGECAILVKLIEVYGVTVRTALRCGELGTARNIVLSFLVHSNGLLGASKKK